MNTTRTTEITETITNLAHQLQEVVEHEPVRKPVLAGIREMRRSLNTLEQELLDESDAPISDAC